MWTIGYEPPSSMIAHKSGVKRTAAVRWDAVSFRLFGLSKPNKESRRADSNRLPLLQLRVIGQPLQGFAQGSKYRIPKRLSFLCLALCCTVLRSRWYQSGINITLVSTFD
jgi:hypothetical protein